MPAYEAMLSETASRLSPADRVLEIGCGTGATAICLAPGVKHWTATDFSTEMVRIANSKPAGENLLFRVGDAEYAFEGGPYDAICAFNVLHLVDDLPDMLARIHDNLRPGGQLISKTWCFAELSPWLRAVFQVLRAFGMFPVASSLRAPQLRQAILASGFEIVDQRIFGAYPQNPYIVARRPVKSAI